MSRRVLRYLKERYPFYVGRNAVYESKEFIDVVDKYTGKVVSRVSAADSNVIDSAIGSAIGSLGDLARMGAYERKNVLLEIAERVRRRQDELSEAISVESGKAIRDSRGEVGRAIDTLTFSAEEAVRFNGEYNRLDISERNAGFESIQARFPIGLVSMIVPFNFPLNLLVHKIGPAIAIGVPFIVKPSEKTPISAAIMGEILSETLLPDGSYAILPCHHENATLFYNDDRISCINFTGSMDVGWSIKSNSGKKKVLLELGGCAACIVDDSIKDLKWAAERIVAGAFNLSGQSCISVQRIFAHKDVYKELVERIDKLQSRLVLGDPLESSTDLGPMISEKDAIRIEQSVANAIKNGSKLLFGGKRDGPFFTPTLLTNVPRDHGLNCQEAFGPIAVIEKYSEFKNLIHLLGNDKYGLQTGLFTNDINRAFYAWRNLNVGSVVINDVPTSRVDSQPYGGVKDSGMGREGVRCAMDEMSEIKVMLMRNVGKL